MEIAIVTRGIKSHSYKYEIAFLDGLKRHAMHCYMHDKKNPITDNVDLVVMWSARNYSLIEDLKRRGINYLILERGYIGDRNEYTSIGYNGLNGYANFVTDKIRKRRVDIFNDLVKPYRATPGDYVMVMGQVPDDASVRHVGFDMWLEMTIAAIKNITDRKIFYRPHPLNKESLPTDVEIIKGDLHDVMAKAHCVVTLNSNSGVDAVLAGIPCISCDAGSMAYEVTNNHLNAVIKPEVFDRERWFNKLTYCQWSINEIEQGQAWEHLRGFYDY